MLENFDSEKNYHDEGDTLRLAWSLFGPWTPPLFLSAGMEDELGFQVGTISLANLAWSKYVPTQLHLYPEKGHCSEDAKTLAHFLAKAVGPSTIPDPPR